MAMEEKMAELNPDGVSVKGCSMIYAPRGQAGEYAALATNPYRGCGHGCAYCYVPDVLHMTRADFNHGAIDRPNFLELLKKDARKYRDLGIREQVMLSFTTDPYHPGHSAETALTRKTLEVLREYDLAFCCLTKGGTRALRDMDLYRPDRDAFASTLTCLDDSTSLRWEPHAALPGDRMDALRLFHEHGIFTWVSLEPTLDRDTSLQIIRETHRFVDLYKIGRVNYLPMTKTTDWRDYTLRVIDLCQTLGVRHYIKHDLQCYLPPGYNNPRRIAQHKSHILQSPANCVLSQASLV